jgi:hypothetical protein
MQTEIKDNGKRPKHHRMVHLEEWVEGKSEAEYIQPIRTKVGLDLPIHELEAKKELMAMYPQWSKEIAEAA